MTSPTSISNEKSTQVTICEEYGYRWWIWEFPGDTDQLKSYWDDNIMANIEKAGCLFHPQSLRGKVVQAIPDTFMEPTLFMIGEKQINRDKNKEHFCHMHELEDSYLTIRT